MKPPALEDVIFFATPAELRSWFEANHETTSELWLGYHLKRSGRPSVAWQDVVDQELCFGWIDSVRYPMGNDMSAQRITPRRKGSVWSAINVRRYRVLERAGLVHPRGRAEFEARSEAKTAIYAYENRSVGLDPAREAAFRKQKDAWKFFESQAPSYRRTAAYWVMNAKRDETRARRLTALIEHSRNRERLPQYVSPSRRRRAP